MDEMPEVGNVRDAARLTQLSVSRLNKLRCLEPENSPPFFRSGKSVRYILSGPNGIPGWIAKRANAARLGMQ